MYSRQILLTIVLLSILLLTSGVSAVTTDFSANITYVGIPPPAPILFTDASTGSPTAWTWFFGDEQYTEPWNMMTLHAGWGTRISHTMIVLPNGSIVTLGGVTAAASARLNDTWISGDKGATWTNVTGTPGWTARSGHVSVALSDGSIVLMGGYDSSNSRKNDTWRSIDGGVTWTLMNASSGWAARDYPGAVALSDDSILLMGGRIPANTNDTWISTDKGSTWSRVNASSGWSTRYYPTVLAMLDGSIVLTGGNDGVRRNATWRSTDRGTTWVNITGSPGWTGRLTTGVVMPDNSIIIAGGYDVSNIRQNNVWRSINNGITWTQINASAGFTARYDHATVVLKDGSIVVAGGNAGTYTNDVWRFQPAGSLLQNPIHSYSIIGNFNVSLQSYTNVSLGNMRKPLYISIDYNPPIVNFTSDVTLGMYPLTVSFTDTSLNFPNKWNWSFTDIDGNYTEVWWSTSQNPTITFNDPGNYWIKLNASNNMGYNISDMLYFITVSATPVTPIAKFTVSNTQGSSPLPVSFTDTSLNYPTAWNWSFRDVTGNNTEIWWTDHKNPNIIFSEGNYLIKLNASNIAGFSISTQITYVNVTPYVTPLIAQFTSNKTSGVSPLSISFTDLSTGSPMPAGWGWLFGDEKFNQSWNIESLRANWLPRFGHSVIAAETGSLIIMGGMSGSTYLNDIWSSTNDGVTWSNVTAHANWSARSGHTTVLLSDGSMVLMGGANTTGRKNDTWRSTDKGAIWQLMNASSGWPIRDYTTAVVLDDDSIILMGGRGASSYLNDTWMSKDKGATWSQLNTSSGWTARFYPSTTILSDGSITLTGGVDVNSRRNDTWRSIDGGYTWFNITANPGWTGRLTNIVSMQDDSIILMGGVDTNNQRKNDVWRSTDYGKNWVLINSSAGWNGRSDFSSVISRNGKIIVLGGTDGTSKNDVWSFSSSTSLLQNPIHTYTQVGRYSVSLQVYNSNEHNQVNKKYYINVKTDIGAENVTPSQPPTQMSKQYTDINVWYGMMVVTMGCLLFSRKLDIKTIRPILFSIIGFITSIVLLWASLSIAYVGNFVEGNIFEFTNQTNTMIYYYQVIQVVTQPWIVMLCIVITIFMIINAIDIGMMYLYQLNNKPVERINWKI